MTPKILHIDMNKFYASVEQMLNPQLKNKAIAVCGIRMPRATCTSASRRIPPCPDGNRPLSPRSGHKRNSNQSIQPLIRAAFAISTTRRIL